MTDASLASLQNPAIDAATGNTLSELKADLHARRARCALLGSTVFTGVGQASNADGEPMLIPDPENEDNFTARVPQNPITPETVGGWMGKITGHSRKS